MTPTPHGRSRYVKGCRCAVCRAANRDYQRRRRNRPAKPLAAVPDSGPDAVPPGPGPVARAVADELAGAPGAGQRPGLVAVALVLAADLDNPDALPQHPAIAHRLTEVLDRLAKTAARRPKLSAVRDMTR